jgi:hypothetical protein
MPIEINFNQKIIFNGKEYKNIEEMPPKERELYERAMQALHSKSSNTVIKKNNKFIFNGREYSNLDEMPVEAQAIFKKAMSKMPMDRDTGKKSFGSLTFSLGPLKLEKDEKNTFTIKTNISKRFSDLWNFPLLLSMGLIVIIIALMRSGKIIDPGFWQKYSKFLWLAVIPIAFIIISVFRQKKRRKCRYCGFSFSGRETYEKTEICPRCHRSL